MPVFRLQLISFRNGGIGCRPKGMPRKDLYRQTCSLIIANGLIWVNDRAISHTGQKTKTVVKFASGILVPAFKNGLQVEDRPIRYQLAFSKLPPGHI